MNRREFLTKLGLGVAVAPAAFEMLPEPPIDFPPVTAVVGTTSAAIQMDSLGVEYSELTTMDPRKRGILTGTY